MFFPGFKLTTVETPAGAFRLRHGGSGPPLLLLHGNPQTHAMWHRVAPELAKTHSVVAPDLRGYGGSPKPAVTGDHAPYGKREMAADMVAIMRAFGHDKFQVVAHDRGARVAHRLALDHPERVEKLTVMDIVPTLEHFERTNFDFAMGYYHWFWLAQPHPIPENLINAAPEAWFRGHTNREPKGDDFFDAEAHGDYLAHIKKPDTVRGICEDYRAAASIDLVHDRESRAAGRKIECPLMVLWGAKGKIGKWYDAPAIWRGYARGPVSSSAVDSGHYLAEEAPAAVLSHLAGFLD